MVTAMCGEAVNAVDLCFLEAYQIALFNIANLRLAQRDLIAK